MSKRTLCVRLAAVCLLFLAPATTCLAQPKSAATSLFDGRTLDGWEGDVNYWRVENGAMVGEIPKGQTLGKNTWLVWRGGELADFDLRLRVKLTGAPAANSGIQFRCQVESVNSVSGYQADLDMGATWLGRIYDEHGRALLVERGTRVLIDPNGRRQSETFAPASEYAVLFRENDWNDYRIVAIGDHIAVYVNGTLFSELKDQQTGQRDLKGSLAFQLHSGPETHVEFREIRLEKLAADDTRLGTFSLKPLKSNANAAASAWRSTHNPLLQHLVPNPVAAPSAAGESNLEQRGTETVSKMFVPAGFSVDVVAAEPDLHQPMAFTFDAKGRIWVVEGHSYPQKRPAGQGLDRILIFADVDGDGSFETRKVFIEGLNLVSGMEVGHGGVWVGAAPELLFIPDKNGDDRPDIDPQVLLDGFGYADTHEALNSFMWGPDGWLYGNQGVFNRSSIGKPSAPESHRVNLQAGVWRYHPTRHSFEVFAHGGSNQWGLDYDEFGQIFITHCRSRWGKGPTTHVMQGGHYWNQVNSGYAPFISATPLPEQPAMRNYMLASARYGHGEGGAGKPGTRRVYGGHSHVGTMIYLGDNWPVEYRNHLFTHNLHGHQLNHQVNVREGGGYNTLHAGQDMLFCADQQYIGIDLQCGPDGAVYISDWYDPRHCHNPNVEHWDRGNGRVYRMKFDATYQPKVVDYTTATDEQLVEAQLHRNDWHVRMARLVLSQRAGSRAISEPALEQLRRLATEQPAADRRLRAVWTLHAIGAVDVELVAELLADVSEYVRGWTVQLAVESLDAEAIAQPLRRLASQERSLLVRRYLAAAIQHVPSDLGWQLAKTQCAQSENATDRELTLLLWYGIARLMPEDLHRALQLADTTEIPIIRDYIFWYAAKLSGEGRDAIAERLAHARADEQLRLLNLFELAVRGMRGLRTPSGWVAIAPRLYASPNPPIRRAAESLGAAFGDPALFTRMRRVLEDEVANVEAKRHALLILASDSSPENLPHYLQQLDNSPLTAQILPRLSPYNDPSVADTLIARLPNWEGNKHDAAMEVLSSRATWAQKVLDAMDNGRLPKSRLTAYYARQMTILGDQRLSDRLADQWGTFGQTSDQLREEIAREIAAYASAPLWAYSAQAGAAHFKTLCAACHQADQQDENIAPKLAGTGSKGIEYLVENVIDPNAVIGRDFLARHIVTVDGRVTTGLIEQETDTAITVRTLTDSFTIAKDQIEEMRVSTNSFMPVGLLNTLNDRERIELLKYVMTF